MILLVPLLIQGGRAASPGLVCIASHGSTACPTMPAALTGNKGSQVSVDVFIQGSDPMNGFDIVVLANHNTLNPINYAMGNVLTSPTVLVVCVGGKPVFPSPPAPPCSSSLPDTFELAAAMSGSLTPSPTTGLLFTVVYNITGTTPSLNGIP